MTREEFGLKLMTSWIPRVILVTILAAVAVFGIDQVEAIYMGCLGHLGGLYTRGLFVLVVVLYYFFMMNTLDPFWLVRKRLWTEGTLYVAVDDEKNRKEPFVWSQQAVPAGVDVTDEWLK